MNLINCRIQIIKSYFSHETDCMFDMVHWNCPNKALKTLPLKYQKTLITSFTKGLEIHVNHTHRVAKKLLISTGIYRSRAEGIMPFIIIEDIMSYYDISFPNPWSDTDPHHIRAGWPTEYSQYIHNDFANDNNWHREYCEDYNVLFIFKKKNCT